MNDIRLEEAHFDYNGKEYILRCNMNVLADVQEEFDGKIGNAIIDPKKTDKAVMAFLAAMMNDYADEQGWEDRYTTRGLGRKLSPKQVPTITVVKLVANALFTKKDETDFADNVENVEEENSKN